MGDPYGLRNGDKIFCGNGHLTIPVCPVCGTHVVRWSDFKDRRSEIAWSTNFDPTDWSLKETGVVEDGLRERIGDVIGRLKELEDMTPSNTLFLGEIAEIADDAKMLIRILNNRRHEAMQRCVLAGEVGIAAMLLRGP